MSLAKCLLSIVASEKWDDRIQGMATDLGEVAPEAIEGTMRYIHARLDKIRGLAQDLGDPLDESDLRATLSYLYIESKMEWCQFNQRISYQTAISGSPDVGLMMQASIGTLLMERIETLFPAHEVEALIDFLSSPIEQSLALVECQANQIGPDQTALDRKLVKGIGQTLQGATDFQKLFASILASREPAIEDGFPKAFEEFEEFSTRSQLLERQLNDVQVHLAGWRHRLSSLTQSTGFRIRLTSKLDPQVELTNDMSEALIQCIETWTEAVVQRGLEETPQKRTESGKSGIIQIHLTSKLTDGLSTTEISDDGVGFDGGSVSGLASCLEPADESGFQAVLPPRAEEEARGAFGTELLKMACAFHRVGGTVTVRSVLGQGSVVRLCLPQPIDLHSESYLLADASSNEFAIAAACVRSVVELRAEEVQWVERQPVVVLQGETLPVIDLARRMGLPAPDIRERTYVVLLTVEHGGVRAALLVDRVMDLRRGMPQPFVASGFTVTPLISGYLSLGREKTTFVLNLVELVPSSRPPALCP